MTSLNLLLNVLTHNVVINSEMSMLMIVFMAFLTKLKSLKPFDLKKYIGVLKTDQN